MEQSTLGFVCIFQIVVLGEIKAILSALLQLLHLVWFEGLLHSWRHSSCGYLDEICMYAHTCIHTQIRRLTWSKYTGHMYESFKDSKWKGNSFKSQHITQKTWKNEAIQLLQNIIIPHLLNINIMQLKKHQMKISKVC